MERLALLAVVVALLVLTMVVPTLRNWRRYGTWPVVFTRDADPLQRLMGVLLGGLLLGLLGWASLLAALGPRALGVWEVSRAATTAGWIMIASGTALEIVAQRHLGASWRIGIDDRPTALVTTGVFAVVRNPIFTGLLLTLLGVVLVTPSPWTVMGYVTAVALIAVQVRLEERHLLCLHGRRYHDYARAVGRFMPWIGRRKSCQEPSCTL